MSGVGRVDFRESAWLNQNMTQHFGIRIGTTLLAAAATAVGQTGVDPEIKVTPDPELVIQDALVAHGGYNTYLALEAIRVEGVIEPSPNPAGDVSIWYMNEPDGWACSRMIWWYEPLEKPGDVTLDGTLLTDGLPKHWRQTEAQPFPRETCTVEEEITGPDATWRFDIARGWRTLDAPPPKPIPGNPALALYELAQRLDTKRFETLPRETFFDDTVWPVVEYEADIGFKRTWYFDVATSRLLGMRHSSGIPADLQTQRTILFEDWVTVDEVTLPARIRSVGVGHQPLTMRITHVELNPDIGTTFDQPAALAVEDTPDDAPATDDSSSER